MKYIEKTFVLVFVTLMVICMTSFDNDAQAQDMVVIVNSDNPIGNMTSADAKNYFLRKVKARWPDTNAKIKPVDRIGDPQEKSYFYEKVLEMSRGDVTRYFMERQYQKAQSTPSKKPSGTSVVDYVAMTPGAIGYVKSSEANGNSSVKVVFAF